MCATIAALRSAAARRPMLPAHTRWCGKLSNHDRLEFAFVGASNLPRPDAPHMRRVLVTFSDRDHFSEQWTRSENGGDTVFDLHFVRRY